MATKNIGGIRTEKVDVTGTGDTYNLEKNGHIISPDYGFLEESGANNNKYNIDGTINAIYGVTTQGAKATVDIGGTGSITGQVGVMAVGTGQFNSDIDGDIQAVLYGVNSTALKAEINVGKNGSVNSGQYGIYSVGTDRFRSNIEGDVYGGQYAVISGAADVKIEVAKGGSVSGGTYGIYAPGAINGSVVNHGSVNGGAGFGVMLGTGSDVRNAGDISGLVGVQIIGDKSSFINEAGSSVIGTTYGVYAGTATGNVSKITNHGLLVAPDAGYAIIGGDGNEKVVSDGKVIGRIALDDGNDRLDLRGGTMSGDFLGGDGDDTLITDKSSHKLIENASEGTDTVQSSVNYKLSSEVERLILTGNGDIDGTGGDTANILRGNGGDNVLKGMAGADELFGGKGVDKLFGGDDADIFHFSKGDGKDTIADLATGIDDVDLSGWNGIGNFTQVLSHAQNDGDGNVVIKNGNDSLTILNMEKGDLDMNDFTF